MAALVPCQACDRFVRAVDAECPFCGASREVVFPRTSRKHVRRAAMLAVALASAPGCSKSEEPTPADGSTLRVDGSTNDATAPVDTGIDTGEIVAPPYGIPPDPDSGFEVPDAGQEDDAGEDDAGEDDAGEDDAAQDDGGLDGEIVAPPYGIPPDPDAGPEDAGPDADSGIMVAPAYGAIPADVGPLPVDAGVDADAGELVRPGNGAPPPEPQ